LRVLDLYHHTALSAAEGALSGAEQLVLRATADELLESAVRLMSLLYHRETARMTPANVLFLVDSEGLADHFPAGLSAWRSVGEMGFRLCVDLSPNSPLPPDYLRELGPDVLRVSGRLVRDVHRHQDEFEYLLMLSRFATRHDMRILAADCVDRRELTALRRAGVSYVQGELVAPCFSTPRRPELTLP
jgi:EAL domain-containing protein (putative c-di-GMP-specific phosphodiesterase class I)